MPGWICPAQDAPLTEMLQKIWDSDEPETYREACLQIRFGDLSDYLQKLIAIYQGGMPNGGKN